MTGHTLFEYKMCVGTVGEALPPRSLLIFNSDRMPFSLWFTFLGCLVLGVSLSEASSPCPPGWFFYKSNCYGYFPIALSWSEAEFECDSYGHGAHLASILGDAEASIIASHVTAYNPKVAVWIGLHDPDQNHGNGLMAQCIVIILGLMESLIT
ncbi:regenerating islet-derived protein 4-like [Eleutherodactylus coqui]|uniref:regenerating islet-derived protein 4-like n=1 Tax=Eleutherodactylus coqui TaxID=57060 RepID=UPI003461A971